jgi:hypothetical protein
VAWTWTFVLSPVAGGRATRLVFRWRGRAVPWWLTVAVHAVIVPADFVMSLGMLRGLAQRAESHHRVGGPAVSSLSGPAPVLVGAEGQR